jgi:membrane-bound lytic murein transglycosylase D
MGKTTGWLRAVAAALAVCAIAFPALSASDPDPFPVPVGLEGHVRFWQSVFTEYDRDEVVVHDMEYPGLSYEVFDLPGDMEDSYTDEQEKLVEALREDWEDRLEKLQADLAAGNPLSVPQKELALKITEAAGADKINGAHKRVRSQRGLRSRFKRGVELANRYDTVFREIFRKEGLPEDLVALPHVESSFQPLARSSAGAAGVWQFTRSTGRQYLSINSMLDERYDPVASAEGAARFLAAAYKRLQNWPIAITSYNHGVNGMSRAQAKFGNDFVRIVHEYKSRYFGFASRNFYAEVVAARNIAADPERFFPEGLQPVPPMDDEALVLDTDLYASNLARRYGVPLKELAELNRAWTRRTVHGVLAVPSGTRVWLPAGSMDRAARGEVPEVDLTPPGLPPEGTHTVRRGENLSVIARDYGMTVTQLRRLNGMEPRDTRIFAGEKLKVAGGRTRFHTVVRGDTLLGIARSYRVDLNLLLRSNRLSLRSMIHPGQKLRIPLG